MDIRTLMKKQAPKEYVKVSGRVLKEHYDLCAEAEIDEQTIIEAAFSEAAEQLAKLKLATAGGRTVITERIPKPDIGGGVFDAEKIRHDFPITAKVHPNDRIIEALKKSDSSLSADELSEIADVSRTYLHKMVLPDLIQQNIIVRKGKGVRGDTYKYYLKGKGDPDISGMLPKGTGMSYMS